MLVVISTLFSLAKQAIKLNNWTLFTFAHLSHKEMFWIAHSSCLPTVLHFVFLSTTLQAHLARFVSTY